MSLFQNCKKSKGHLTHCIPLTETSPAICKLFNANVDNSTDFGTLDIGGSLEANRKKSI